MANRARPFCILLSVLCHALGASQAGAVEDHPSRFARGAEARTLWSHLVAGWRAERENLRTYELRVSGVQTRYKSVQEGGAHRLIEPFETKHIDLHIIADRVLGNVRTEVKWGSGDQSTGTWIATREKVVQWAAMDSAVVEIDAPTANRHLFAVDLDPRALGFTGAEESLLIRDRSIYDEVVRFYQGGTSVEQIEKLPRGRYLVALALKNTKIGDSYRLDELLLNAERGFSIERLTYRWAGESPSSPGDIDGEITVSWDRKDDQWVPVGIREIRRSGLNTVEMELDWKAINRPFHEKQFDLDGIGAPKGTFIVDRQLGPDNSFLVGKLGVSRYAGDPPQSGPLPRFPLRTRTFRFLLANLLLLTLFVAALMYARRRRRRDPRG